MNFSTIVQKFVLVVFVLVKAVQVRDLLYPSFQYIFSCELSVTVIFDTFLWVTFYLSLEF